MFWYERPRKHYEDTTSNSNKNNTNKEIKNFKYNEFLTKYIGDDLNPLVGFTGDDDKKNSLLEKSLSLDKFIEEMQNSMVKDLDGVFKEFQDNLRDKKNKELVAQN